jgi:hypothetical protein
MQFRVYEADSVDIYPIVLPPFFLTLAYSTFGAKV